MTQRRSIIKSENKRMVLSRMSRATRKLTLTVGQRLTEYGRSMTEMLGVLAIMGILTIGGIVGYRYATDYMMTNAIITGIRARAVIVIQQRVLGYELNLQEFHPNTPEDLIYGRFPVEAVNDYLLRGEGHQALEVFNIPHRVCKNIYNTSFGEEITLIVNGVEEDPNGLNPCLPDGVTEDSADEEDIYHNVVAFVFGNGAPCEDDNDCPNAACWECSPLGMCIPKAKDTPCGAGGCCDGNGGCTQCVIACDPDEVASTCRTSCDTSTGNWNLKAAGTKCGANNCGVCDSDGQCVGDNTKTITKCDGTREVCCAADADCEDESPCSIDCTETPNACQKCDTSTGTIVADTDKNGTAVNACQQCQNGSLVARTDITLTACQACTNGEIVSANEGASCGTCGQCQSGVCESKSTTITKCDGSTESCCPLTETCENEQNCECPSGYQTNSCTTTTLDTKTLGDGITCYKCEAPSCPNGGDFGTDGTTCCKDNRAWDEDDASYTIINIPVCGCPEIEGLSLGNDGITCCGEGLAFTGDGTENSVNISACGCPLGGTLIDETTCCRNGYVWRDGTQGEGGVVPHEANVALCGCPSGTTFGTDNTTCCKNGRALNADLSMSSSNVVPSICGCPDGGEFGYDNETCCRRGYAWDMTTQSYRNLNTVCGCPNGGYYGTDNATCCKNKIAWNGSAYEGAVAEVCGCPAEYPNEERCYGGYSIDSITLNNGVVCHKCGEGECPNAGTLGTDNLTCCNWNGFSWDEWEQEYILWAPEVCGCPSGGNFQNGGCCSGGRAWDGDSYTSINIPTCGCPDTGVLMGENVCCWDGKKWDGNDYEIVSEVCRGECPVGSSPNGLENSTNVDGCNCNSSTPIWDGTECVECSQNSDCGDCYSCEEGWCKRRSDCCVNDTECISPCQTCTENSCETTLGWKVEDGICKCLVGSTTGTGQETNVLECRCEEGDSFVNNECIADDSGCAAEIANEENDDTMKNCCSVVGNTVICASNDKCSGGGVDVIKDLNIPSCHLVGDGVGFRIRNGSRLDAADITVRGAGSSIHIRDGSVITHGNLNISDSSFGLSISAAGSLNVGAALNSGSSYYPTGDIIISNIKDSTLGINSNGNINVYHGEIKMENSGGISIEGAALRTYDGNVISSGGVTCSNDCEIEAGVITASTDIWVDTSSKITASSINAERMENSGTLDCKSINITGRLNNKSGIISVSGNVQIGELHLKEGTVSAIGDIISNGSIAVSGELTATGMINGRNISNDGVIKAASITCLDGGLSNTGTVDASSINAIGNVANSAGVYNYDSGVIKTATLETSCAKDGCSGIMNSGEITATTSIRAVSEQACGVENYGIISSPTILASSDTTSKGPIVGSCTQNDSDNYDCDYDTIHCNYCNSGTTINGKINGKNKGSYCTSVCCSEW